MGSPVKGAARRLRGVHLTCMVKFVSMAMLVVLLAGCSPSHTDSLERHTADATAAAKRSAGAIARGVAEGLVRKGPVDINSASASELGRLPGVTSEQAGKIIEHRPYKSTRDLVRRHVLSKDEFDRVKSQIFVK
ncbi:helix-hairpin-helix domain-containing protein [Edaphobacter sp. HDX4]|uniref:helix-hairpin-helix domain-containing protein n=1 Tax=Edaphobacter sp. HDX4 TaxID=2794064 RepID=UPI002FE6C234